MSFRENLIKARSHIVFLIALGCGLGIVVSIEAKKSNESDGVVTKADEVMGVSSPMDAFENLSSLPLATARPSTPEDLANARIAWQYFVNNTNDETGLVNSANGYPSTTMWETGSYFVAVISADLLGLIESDAAKDRISKALDTLATMRLFDDSLPNKAYNVQTGELVDYGNNPVERGLGWSALDIARIVGAFGHVEQNYPDLSPKIALVMARWDLPQMVENGQLIGGNMVDGNLRRDQEGRVGYEQYASKAMMLYGFDMYRAYQTDEYLMVREVFGQPIPVDNRLHRNITPAFTVSEPYLFDGLEFGFDARSIKFASAIYNAQEARWAETGTFTAVSETHIDVAPYFVYSSVWGGGAPWAVMTFSGDRMDSRRTISTKAAFAWDALFDTDYTQQLVAQVSPLGELAKGFPEGIYEADGTTNSSVTTNTNAVVLAALAFSAHGPLIRSIP